MEELINSGRYDTRDDFTVVDQPFFKETYPPEKVRTMRNGHMTLK